MDMSLTKGSQVAVLSLETPSMYSIEAGKVKIAGEVIVSGYGSLLDTGNTLICLPMKFLSNFYKIMKKKNINCKLIPEGNPEFYQVGCKLSSAEEVPDFSVELDGIEFVVKGEQLIDRCKKEFIFFGDSECLLRLEFQSGGFEMILGQTFLATTYTSFFLDRREIWITQPGIIPSKKSSPAADSAPKKRNEIS